jgi:hypothetical protein
MRMLRNSAALASPLQQVAFAAGCPAVQHLEELISYRRRCAALQHLVCRRQHGQLLPWVQPEPQNSR